MLHHRQRNLSYNRICQGTAYTMYWYIKVHASIERAFIMCSHYELMMNTLHSDASKAPRL